jgi:hypothetical protein
VKLEVVVAERKDAFRLLKGAEAEVGSTVALGEGLRATFQGARVLKTANYPTVAAFDVEGSGAAAGDRVWTWLSATLPDGAQGVVFDGIDAPYDEATIKRIVASKLG